MRFWLRKGVDGFRVDVVWHLIKDAQFRDNPVNPHYVAGQPLSSTVTWKVALWVGSCQILAAVFPGLECGAGV